MSSRFAPSKPSIKLPVVCIKPRPNLPPPYPSGRPNILHVTAWWYDATTPAHLAESFPLWQNAVLPGWSGSSGFTGLNLQVSVQIMPAADTYDIAIELRRNLTVLDDDSWHGVIIAPGPPFKSGLLQHIYVPATDANGVRVLD